MTLPTDAKERKAVPVYSGFVKYFPLSMAAVAKLSAEGNEQHNPGSELHWDRTKSGDEMDALMRHIIGEDWVEVAWRAMANLEKHLENSNSQKIAATHPEYIDSLQYSVERSGSGMSWHVFSNGVVVGLVPVRIKKEDVLTYFLEQRAGSACVSSR